MKSVILSLMPLLMLLQTAQGRNLDLESSLNEIGDELHRGNSCLSDSHCRFFEECDTSDISDPHCRLPNLVVATALIVVLVLALIAFVVAICCPFCCLYSICKSR